jgi:hypothetical protein
MIVVQALENPTNPVVILLGALPAGVKDYPADVPMIKVQGTSGPDYGPELLIALSMAWCVNGRVLNPCWVGGPEVRHLTTIQKHISHEEKRNQNGFSPSGNS